MCSSDLLLRKSGGFPQICLYWAPVATAGISSLKVSWVRGISIIRRKKEEGRRKKEEGRGKKEEGRRKREEGRRKKEEAN